MPCLTDPRREMFCALVAEGGRPAECWAKAGYTKDDPPRERRAKFLLRDEDVQKRIKEIADWRMIAFIERSVSDAKFVIAELRTQYERCAGKIPWPNGKYIIYPSNATRALELLGKTMSMFVERVHHSGAQDRGAILQLLEKVSSAELAQIALAGGAADAQPSRDGGAGAGSEAPSATPSVPYVGRA